MPFSRLELFPILIIPGPEVVLFTLLFRLSLGHFLANTSVLSVESGKSFSYDPDVGPLALDRERG